MAKCSGSAKKARAYVQRYKESEKHCTDANAYCTKRSFSKLSVGAYKSSEQKSKAAVWQPCSFAAILLCGVRQPFAPPSFVHLAPFAPHPEVGAPLANMCVSNEYVISPSRRARFSASAISLSSSSRYSMPTGFHK